MAGMELFDILIVVVAALLNTSRVARISDGSERALPEMDFRRCARNVGDRVRSSGSARLLNYKNKTNLTCSLATPTPP
jgi:hypothetical protein